MGNLDGYNANEWEPNVGFEPIPAGEYKVIISSSELKDTSAGDGKRLALELQVIEGQYEGRKLFDGLNLVNPSEKAVQIAKGTLSAICRAVGKMTPKDSTELHNIPLLAKVSVEPRNDTGEPSNRVKGYKPVESNGTPQLSQASPPPPTKGKSPWQK